MKVHLRFTLLSYAFTYGQSETITVPSPVLKHNPALVDNLAANQHHFMSHYSVPSSWMYPRSKDSSACSMSSEWPCLSSSPVTSTSECAIQHHRSVRIAEDIFCFCTLMCIYCFIVDSQPFLHDCLLPVWRYGRVSMQNVISLILTTHIPTVYRDHENSITDDTLPDTHHYTWLRIYCIPDAEIYYIGQ